MARKQLIGTVVSDRMEKTVVVEVERLRRHPRYLKSIRSHRRFKADDTLGVKVGDRVRLEETRPLSKTKRWRVVEVIR